MTMVTWRKPHKSVAARVGWVCIMLDVSAVDLIRRLLRAPRLLPALPPSPVLLS
jgi:hypothetical protein